MNALILPALLRGQKIWLARAHDAIRRGMTEAQFVGQSEFGQDEARASYGRAISETQTRQAFVAELTTVN